MKKLKNIKIKYFQTHEDTNLEFANGITVLVGKTDSGKTAIIRAIKLITKNKPRGNGFISAFFPADKKNKPTSKVTLTLEDDTEITRTKSENKNEYTIKKNELEESFNNFGVNIPPEVEQEIGLTAVQIDQDTALDVNIAEQLSQPFLLFESPSVKTKLIDKIARIDVLNKAIKNTKNEQNEIKAKQKVLKENLEKTDKELEFFTNIEQEKENLEKIKQLYNSLIEKQKLLEKYKQLKQALNDINIAIEKGQKTKQELVSFISLSTEKIKTVKENFSKVELLTKCHKEYVSYMTEINDTKNILSNKESILTFSKTLSNLKNKVLEYEKLSELSNKLLYLNQSFNTEMNIKLENQKVLQNSRLLNDLKNKVMFLDKINNLQNQLLTLSSSIDTAHAFIPQQQEKVRQAIQELNNLYNQIKICPVCKRAFDGGHNHGC